MLFLDSVICPEPTLQGGRNMNLNKHLQLQPFFPIGLNSSWEQHGEIRIRKLQSRNERVISNLIFADL